MPETSFHKSVFIIIPAYNEYAVIKNVAAELLSSGYTVIIVDDASKETLWPELKDLDGIYYIRHQVNLGQGAALQTGIDFALQKDAAYLVTFDADGQHSATDIPAMLLPLQKEGVDITLASRFLTKGLHNASLLRQWTLKTGRWVNYFFTGIYLSDAHNGLRAMTSGAAKKIQLKENRMAHATEILYAIKKNKLKYKEVPASVTYTDYSKEKGQSAFNSIRIFFDLLLHKLFE
jgi:glycosyltransferase involved in cell wall biosynthesis